MLFSEKRSCLRHSQHTVWDIRMSCASILGQFSRNLSAQTQLWLGPTPFILGTIEFLHHHLTVGGELDDGRTERSGEISSLGVSVYHGIRQIGISIYCILEIAGSCHAVLSLLQSSRLVYIQSLRPTNHIGLPHRSSSGHERPCPWVWGQWAYSHSQRPTAMADDLFCIKLW